MTEEWRSIAGYEYYEVSNLGRVRSLDKVTKTVRRGTEGTILRQGRVLSQPTDKYGRHYVTLKDSPKPKKNYMVHRLVSEAFISPIPEGKEVDHMNGNHKDNRVDNLRYLTRQENMMFSGPAYRVLCQEYGQDKADELVRQYKNNKETT